MATVSLNGYLQHDPLILLYLEAVIGQMLLLCAQGPEHGGEKSWRDASTGMFFCLGV